MSKSRLIVLQLNILFLGMFACLSRAGADGIKIEQTYAWYVNIATEEMPGFLKYKNSPDKNAVKAMVTYRKGDAQEGDSKRYEVLWYNQCKPAGMDRYKKDLSDLRPGDQIAIRITQKSASASPQENCAAANAVLRVLLDANMNGNMVTAVLVPAHSFDSIVQGFGNQRVYPVPAEQGEQATQGAIFIHLYSEQEGMSKLLVYQGQ